MWYPGRTGFHSFLEKGKPLKPEYLWDDGLQVVALSLRPLNVP